MRNVITVGICTVAVVALVCVLTAEAQLFGGKKNRRQRKQPGVIESLISGPKKHDIDVAGREREYFVYEPDKFDEAPKPVPLLFVLHGGTGTARASYRTTRFHKLADRERFLVVYPQGYKKQWSDARLEKSEKFKFLREIDDVAFFRKMIAELKDKYPVDPNRIYITGISNGGFMAERLAIELADQIAAIGPVVGGMAEDLARNFHPAEPVSAIIINGTGDPLVPYEGGQVAKKEDNGRTIGIEQIVKLWVEHNGCSSTPKTTDLPNRSNDGTQVTKYEYTGGRNGTAVTFVKVINGGHNWPGAEPYLTEKMIGKTCTDFDSFELIWDFFKQHPKRGSSTAPSAADSQPTQSQSGQDAPAPGDAKSTSTDNAEDD